MGDAPPLPENEMVGEDFWSRWSADSVFNPRSLCKMIKKGLVPKDVKGVPECESDELNPKGVYGRGDGQCRGGSAEKEVSRTVSMVEGVIFKPKLKITI